MHILSLPPELTLECFFYLVENHDFLSVGKKFGMGWISVTHVCRTWRNLALECPGLWADIPSTLPRLWLDTFLERSQDYPLKLDGAYLDDGNSWLEEILPRALHRVRYLSLRSGDALSPYFYSLLQSHHAPELRFLRINNACFEGGYHRTRLFGGIAPRLRELDLDYLGWFPWKTPIFHNLTKLSAAGDMTDIADFMLALQSMHLLEHLSLVADIHNIKVNIDAAHIIRLDRLETLYLGGDFRIVHCVYRNLRHQPLTRIHLSHSMVPSQDSDFVSLLNMLSTHPSRQYDAYQTISVFQRYHNNVGIKAWTDDILIGSTEFLRPTFYLEVHSRFERDLPLTMITACLINALLFPNVRRLSVSEGCDFRFVTVAARQLSAIRALDFDYEHMQEQLPIISDILWSLSWAVTPEGQSGPIFPQLETLSFATEKWGLMSYNMRQDNSAAPFKTLLDTLSRLALDREELGIPLRTVLVHPSTLRADPTSDPITIPSELEHLITEDTSPEDYARRQLGRAMSNTTIA